MEYTVSQINAIISNVFKSENAFHNTSIKGEISNCKPSSSGHIYFSLKDEKCVIPCVIFAGRSRNLKFTPKDGNKVVITGNIEVYEPQGRFQVIVNSMRLDGDGDLMKKYEELKEKLKDAGYFSDMYKKQIPKYSMKIGIVTAKTGAVIQDIRNVSKRRNPFVKLYLYPATVQGDGAVETLIKGLTTLDKMGLDAIIIGRGGGSFEDLWCFNDEKLADVIFKCNTTIVSAVGHETDFTICDFVSDLRAPTPSAAAELCVFNYYEFEKELNEYRYKLRLHLNKTIDYNKNAANEFLKKIKLLSPMSKLNIKKQRLDDYNTRMKSYISHKLEIRWNKLDNLKSSLNNSIERKVSDRRNSLSIYAERLNGLSPVAKLSKGYALVEENGKALTDVENVKVGDSINIHLYNGDLSADVKEIKKVDRK